LGFTSLEDCCDPLYLGVITLPGCCVLAATAFCMLGGGLSRCVLGGAGLVLSSLTGLALLPMVVRESVIVWCRAFVRG
jgi:hypothetical protein